MTLKVEKNLIEQAFVISWPVVGIGVLIVYLITQNRDDTLSFLLGAATGLMVNSLNYRIMKTTFKSEPSLIQRRTMMMALVRFVLYGAILYVTYVMGGWNLYLTAGGILVFRVVPSVLTLVKHGKAGGDADGV